MTKSKEEIFNTANRALIDAHKDYIKVLKERIDDKDETINYWKELVSDKNYKIKQSKEKITKLKDMLDDVTDKAKYGPKFYEFDEVIDDLKEILNKPIWEI